MVSPWQTTGAAVAAPPEAWRWIAAWVSRQGRSAGMGRPLLDFIAASEAASRAAVTTRVPSTEVATGVPGRLEELDVGTVAVRLGCTPRWVRYRCETGHFKARKVGRQWLIDPSSIDRQTPKEGSTGW